MAIGKLDHISILARNPQPVLDFYGGFLGFESVDRREVPELGMIIFDLKARDDFVEVIQPTGEGMKVSDGIKHVAFLSDSIDEDFALFSARGATLIHKEVQRHGNVRFFFVKGPVGEWIEIVQYL